MVGSSSRREHRPTVDRDIVLRQMNLSAGLIVAGGVIGIIAMVFDDAQMGLALGTAVIGAGAAMLPTGAAAGASARISHEAEHPQRVVTTARVQQRPQPGAGEITLGVGMDSPMVGRELDESPNVP